MAFSLQIGALARRTGTTPKALRLYEEMGLLPAPARRGRYRIYGDLHLETVNLIRQAMALGFKLRELQQLTQQARLVDVLGIELLKQLCERKRAALNAQMAALRAQIDALAECERRLEEAKELASLCPELLGT